MSDRTESKSREGRNQRFHRGNWKQMLPSLVFCLRTALSVGSVGLEVHLGWKEFLCLIAKPDTTFECRWLWKYSFCGLKVMNFSIAFVLPADCFAFVLPADCLPSLTSSASPQYSVLVLKVHLLQGRLILPPDLEADAFLPLTGCCDPGQLSVPVCYHIIVNVTPLRDARLQTGLISRDQEATRS